MKKGLVLEGGAMRGVFTTGILDVMLEEDIEFDGAVGVSAGAAFGVNYKSRQIGRAIRYNKSFCNDSRYCSVKSLIKTGDIYGAKFCYDTIPNELDPFDYETYRNNPMEFFAVVTDVATGKPIYKKLTSCDKTEMDWLRASASMPVVSRPVKIDTRSFLDGGISDSIPLKFMEYKGYDKIVVILTQPIEYRKHLSRTFSMTKLALTKYPAIAKGLENRPEMYNREVEYVLEQEKKGKIFVLRPEEAFPISKTEKNPEKLEMVYQIGRRTMIDNLDRLKEFLEK